MVSRSETAISMAFFRPVHLGTPPGYRADYMMTWHDDVARGGVTFLEYLLIIHLRKKYQSSWRNTTDIFWADDVAGHILE